MTGIVECIFLAGAAIALYVEWDSTCDDADAFFQIQLIQTAKIRTVLGILFFMHILSLFRVGYKICIRTNKNFKGRQGLCKCLIVDAYCCCGFLAYVYSQFTTVLHFDDCRDDGEMQATHAWLVYEFIYQYTQVLVYFLTNCSVIAVMLYAKKRERDEKMSAIQNMEG